MSIDSGKNKQVRGLRNDALESMGQAGSNLVYKIFTESEFDIDLCSFIICTEDVVA